MHWREIALAKRTQTTRISRAGRDSTWFFLVQTTIRNRFRKSLALHGPFRRVKTRSRRGLQSGGPYEETRRLRLTGQVILSLLFFGGRLLVVRHSWCCFGASSMLCVRRGDVCVLLRAVHRWCRLLRMHRPRIGVAWCKTATTHARSTSH